MKNGNVCTSIVHACDREGWPTTKGSPVHRMENPVVTVEDLKHSPSQAAGLPWEAEERFRFLTCQLIQAGGLLLKLPQSAMLTGQVLVHQLFCRRSFLNFAVLDAAMAALFVAGKVEECHRRARDIVNVFHWLYHRLRGIPWSRLGYVSEEYYGWRDRLTAAEMALLRELGFHVQPSLPNIFLLSYLKTFDGLFSIKVNKDGDGPSMAQLALNILNDSFRSTACIRYQPNVLACAAIQLAAEQGSLELPHRWYVAFDVPDMAQLEACMRLMERVYGCAGGGGGRRIKYDPELPLTPRELTVYAQVFLADERLGERRPRSRTRSPTSNKRIDN